MDNSITLLSPDPSPFLFRSSLLASKQDRGQLQVREKIHWNWKHFRIPSSSSSFFISPTQTERSVTLKPIWTYAKSTSTTPNGVPSFPHFKNGDNNITNCIVALWGLSSLKVYQKRWEQGLEHSKQCNKQQLFVLKLPVPSLVLNIPLLWNLSSTQSTYNPGTERDLTLSLCAKSNLPSRDNRIISFTAKPLYISRHNDALFKITLCPVLC